MSQAFRNIGFIVKSGDPRVVALLATLVAHCRQRGLTVVVDHAAAKALPDAEFRGQDRETLAGHADLIVVVGGDGTMLNAARVVARRNVPLVGVNAGRLGFLTDLPASNAVTQLDGILNGRFHQEQRLLLDMRSAETAGLALNDIVVHKRDGGRMIEFETWVNGAFVCAHRADGVVVTTPTGSTAYALSAGGPILHPQLDAIAIVPICPHTLSDRPIVVGMESSVEIVLTSERGVGAQVTCDGQAGTKLPDGARVTIRRAKETLILLHPLDYDYFGILRTKLHWGRGQNKDIGR